MEFPRSEAFSKHVENFRLVKKSLKQLSLAHKAAIRQGSPRGDGALIEAMARSHYLHVGIFAEARLRVIVTDPTGISDEAQERVWRKRSQDDRWVQTITEAASCHYQIESLSGLTSDSGVEIEAQLASLKSLLRGPMASAITDRNKLAHAQWAHQLKSMSDVEFLASPRIVDLNYCQIERQHQLIEAIAQLVGILVVSRPTFERDYARIIGDIMKYSAPVSEGEYVELVELLRSRAPGVKRRDLNTN